MMLTHPHWLQSSIIHCQHFWVNYSLKKKNNPKLTQSNTPWGQWPSSPVGCLPICPPLHPRAVACRWEHCVLSKGVSHAIGPFILSPQDSSWKIPIRKCQQVHHQGLRVPPGNTDFIFYWPYKNCCCLWSCLLEWYTLLI